MQRKRKKEKEKWSGKEIYFYSGSKTTTNVI